MRAARSVGSPGAHFVYVWLIVDSQRNVKLGKTNWILQSVQYLQNELCSLTILRSSLSSQPQPAVVTGTRIWRRRLWGQCGPCLIRKFIRRLGSTLRLAVPSTIIIYIHLSSCHTYQRTIDPAPTALSQKQFNTIRSARKHLNLSEPSFQSLLIPRQRRYRENT